MAKSKIEQLIASQKPTRSGQSLKQSLPSKLYKSLDEDFRTVVEAYKQGKPIPSYRVLRKYVLEEYKIDLSVSSIYQWVTRLKEESGCAENR